MYWLCSFFHVVLLRDMGGIFLRDCCLIKDLAEYRFVFLWDRRRDVVK